MAKIEFKAGSKIIKKDFPKDLIQRTMERVLSEHQHLCGTCESYSCAKKRNIRNELVIRGVETSERNYIFDCLGYKRRKSNNITSSEGYTNSGLTRKYGYIFGAPYPEVLDESTLVDDYIESLETVSDIEDEYGDLLPEDTATLYMKRRRR